MHLLTDEQKAFAEDVRRLVEEKVAPRAAEIDQKGEFPWDVKEAFQKAGLLGISVPQEYGGTFRGYIFTILAVEQISRVCASSSLVVQVQSLGWTPILVAGSDEQKKRYGPKVASGEMIAAFGLTEPDAGSDAAAMKTRAVRQGDKYILDGIKHFISNGPVADLVTVFGMTDAEKGVRGISAFIVEAKWPGYSVHHWEKKMGIRGSPTGQLLFEKMEIPAENLLGEEGRGFAYAMQTLDASRPVIAAQAVGIAQGALENAVKFAKERVQFGQPIANFQGISWMLADMTAQVEAARALTRQAAMMLDANDPRRTYMSACCKLIASDTAMKVTTDALQIAGGYGYLTDYPFERMMRNAKITQIYEGTNQIQRLVIARELLR